MYEPGRTQFVLAYKCIRVAVKEEFVLLFSPTSFTELQPVHHNSEPELVCCDLPHPSCPSGWTQPHTPLLLCYDDSIYSALHRYCYGIFKHSSPYLMGHTKPSLNVRVCVC